MKYETLEYKEKETGNDTGIMDIIGFIIGIITFISIYVITTV